LTRGGVLVPLRPKSFTLLKLLVAQAGQVLTKDALLDAVWPNVTVTEDSLTQAIRDVRTAIGDSSAVLLRSIRGRGYLLDLVPEDARTQPDRSAVLPRVLVLPFVTRPHDANMALRMEALTEDVVAGLTRYRTLRVVSTVSAREAIQSGQDAMSVAKLLRADYLIEGTAFLQDDGVILRLSMTDTASMEQVWRDTLDCTGAAVLSAWNTILARVIGYLVNGIEVEAPRHKLSNPTDSISAYDHRARGLALWMSDDPDTARRCLEHFRAAVTADPGFALAWTHMAWADLALHEVALAPPDVLARTLEYSRRAVELAPFDGRTHSGLGYNLAICGDFAAAEANVRFGMQLNPSSVDCLFDLAVVLLFRGRPVEVIRTLDQAADLCPLRIAYDAHIRATALFMIGRYSEAADNFMRLPFLSYRRSLFLAAALAKADRVPEALAVLSAVLPDRPDQDHLDIMRRGYNFEHASDAKHLLDSVALALEHWHQFAAEKT
jgi:TolB-like protein